MKDWFNYTAVLQIIVVGLIIGAGLPALFSLGVRLNAEGVGLVAHDGGTAQRNPVLLAISWALFGLVLVAVIVGVLFVARDFIGHHTGMYILGAKHK
ncbi:MAG: rane protein [Mycobacterium sp.]|nr:rane protein [Mycobacterium sp.]